MNQRARIAKHLVHTTIYPEALYPPRHQLPNYRAQCLLCDWVWGSSARLHLGSVANAHVRDKHPEALT